MRGRHASGWAARAEAFVGACALGASVLGLTLSVLTTPAYVRTLVRAVGSAELTGISEEQTLNVAESVRVFVVDHDAPDLPLSVAGRPGFDAAAVAHLIDVRDVLIPARWITAVLAVVALAWVAIRRRSAEGRLILSAALRGSAAALLALVCTASVVGAGDFDSLFAWFHGLFFAEGTWMFPSDALLIRVFPLPFWITAGATWGALVAAAAAALWLCGRRLRFTEGTYGV